MSDKDIKAVKKNLNKKFNVPVIDPFKDGVSAIVANIREKIG